MVKYIAYIFSLYKVPLYKIVLCSAKRKNEYFYGSIMLFDSWLLKSVVCIPLKQILKVNNKLLYNGWTKKKERK